MQFLLLTVALFSSVYTFILAYRQWTQKNRLGAVILFAFACSFPIFAWLEMNTAW